ncbi:hypothetical protein ACOSP7_006319 [Xanthoceras sorbifolium]
MEGAKVELEIGAVDYYKRSLVFNAFMYLKFENGMKECESLLEGMVDKDSLAHLKVVIRKNQKQGEET